MENRREFLKKVGVAGGLGTAGALTLNKEYVKPVVTLLEPSAAHAQTPALSVGAASWSQPVMDGTVIVLPANTLTITVDLPGGSPPISGSTFNVFMSLTPLEERSGWATAANIPVGSTVNSDTIDNVGVAGPGGVVQFAINFGMLTRDVPPTGQVITINGVPVTPLGLGTVVYGVSNIGLMPGLRSGDRSRICLHVDADAGATISGTPYPAQPLGFWCFEGLWS